MTTDSKPYELGDCFVMSARHPGTFALPAPAVIAAVKPGDHVKLLFEGVAPGGADCFAERMWVQVTRADGGSYAGTLANEPAYLPLEHGQVIEFTAANIAQVDAGPAA